MLKIAEHKRDGSQSPRNNPQEPGKETIALLEAINKKKCLRKKGNSKDTGTRSSYTNKIGPSKIMGKKFF